MKSFKTSSILKISILATIAAVSSVSFAQEAPSQSSVQVKPTVNPEILQSSAVHGPSSNQEENQTERYSATFYTLGGYDIHQFDRPRPSYAIYDSYFAFTVKVHRDLRFSAMPTFGYTTAGYDYLGKEVTDKVLIRDFSFAATHYNLFEQSLPDSLDLKLRTRLYLPTSDQSKDEGMVARLRLENELRYYFDKTSSFRAYVKPSYYFQRTTTFVDYNNKIKSTRQADSQHGAEYNYRINKYFSLLPAFEFEDKWSFSSNVNNRDQRHDNTIAYRFGIEVRPIREFNFIIGYEDKRDLIQPDRDPQLGYSLLTNLVIF